MKPVILAVLDGWGIGKNDESNPIYTTELQTIKYIEENFPSFSLKAGGVSVGLPWGEIGNSELGHLTIGAGRLVEQEYMKIKKSIDNEEFFNNEVLKKAFDHAKKNNSGVHLVGLLSEAKTNSAIDHLEALLEMAKKEEVGNVYLQLFADGKDGSPRSIKQLIDQLRIMIDKKGVGNIVSVTGRYLAMDTEENWDRTEKAYKALTEGAEGDDFEKAVEEIYSKNLNDAFVNPAEIDQKRPILENDSVIFFNFKGSNIYQLAKAFSGNDFPHFPTKKMDNLLVVSMTEYGKNLPFNIAFPVEPVNKTLGEVLASNGKSQMKIAEQYKWPHVTYFFNGLREEPFDKEYRIMIPSEKIGKVEEYPEMQSSAITDRVITTLQGGGFDFVLINYANADVMAHTGNYEAVSQAVKAIDKELNKIIRTILEIDATLVITSGQGNAESMLDPSSGNPLVGHSSNPVPLYIVGNRFSGRTNEIENAFLADVAPTILSIMGLPQPVEMTGKALI